MDHKYLKQKKEINELALLSNILKAPEQTSYVQSVDDLLKIEDESNVTYNSPRSVVDSLLLILNKTSFSTIEYVSFKTKKNNEIDLDSINIKYHKKPMGVFSENYGHKSLLAYSKSTRKTYTDHRFWVNQKSNTLTTGRGCSNQSTHNIIAVLKNGKFKTRDLTPRECEYLMGYPLDFTKYGKNKNGESFELSSSSRFRLCGNGIHGAASLFILDQLVKEPSVKIGSLFSGCMGTESKLGEAHFKSEVVFVSDINKGSCLNLEYKHTGLNVGDIKEINPEELPDFDLLLSGFPCQPFSVSGKRQGEDDEKGRGNLVFNVFDIISTKKPKYVMLENVKNILTISKKDNGKTFLRIISILKGLGYSVDYQLVDTCDLGYLQQRKRVFIVGVKNEAR